MSLLQVIKQIEGAIHSYTYTSKHITFWDIRRAFNSVSKTLQKLAWKSMGVSMKGVAELVIKLDDGGLSFFDTPLYANTSALHSHKDMLYEKKHMCGVKNIKELFFDTERGIRQGERASRLQRTLLYDMVLEWIDPKNTHLHMNENLLEYSDKIARDAALFAYADDLATCYAGPRAKYMQQLQAK
jgi:hypothetical protein